LVSSDASNIDQQRLEALLVYVALCPIRFGGIRHTCATLLLTRVVHPRSFKELLGHPTIAITLDTCSHVLLECRTTPPELSKTP